MTEVDTSNLDASIAFQKRRIKAIDVSIRELEIRISDYDCLIAAGGGGYDIAALRSANEHAQGQIDRMAQESSAAKSQIAECRRMIEFLKTNVRREIILDASDDLN